MRSSTCHRPAVLLPLVCALLGLGLATAARAANFVWDVTPGNTGASDGSGTWTPTGGNWFDETTPQQDQPWSNSAGNTAVFGAGGTAGTVTVSGTVNTNGLIFRAVNLSAGPAYTLSGGTIALADGSAITLQDNSSSVAANGRVVFNSTLTGNNITIQKAAGTTLALVTLGVASNLSGVLTLASADNSGLFLQVNNANAFPTSTLTQVVVGSNVSVVLGAGGTWATPFTLTGTGAGGRGAIRVDVNNTTLSGSITLAGSALITQNTSAATTLITGSIGESSTSTLNLGTQGTSTGTIALGGNNTFTGGLNIDVTNVRIDNAGALNSTAPNRVTFASTALAKNLSLNGNSITIASLASATTGLGAGTGTVRNQSATAATLTISSTTDTNFGGTLTDGTGGGALAIVKTGANSQTLSGTNSFTGGLTMNQGTLILSGTNSFAGGLTMNQGTLTLSGTSTYTGGLTLNQGTVNLNSSTALGAAASTFTINGGSVANSSGAAIAIANGNAIVINADFTAALTNSTTATLDLGTGPVSLGTAAGTTRTITVSGTGNTLFINGSIADGTTATGITKTGVGTLTLGGTSTYTGLTAVTVGNLRVRSNGALGSTADGTQVESGSRLQLENNVTITGEALITPYLESVGGSNVWNGTVRAAIGAQLTLDSSATGGSLVITGDVNAASTDSTAHTFNLTGSGNGEVRGVISNTLTFNKTGTGTWILSGANTYNNVTNISAGSLQVGKAGQGQTGTGTVTVAANASLLGTGIVRGSLTLSANANLYAGDGTAAGDHGTLTFTPVTTATYSLASGSKTFLGLTTATVTDGSFGGFAIGTAGYNTWVDSVTGVGGHDRLVFNGTSGTLTVAGNITVLSSSYTPRAGDVFNLVDWATVLTTNFSGFDAGTNLRTGAEDNGLQFDLPDLTGTGLFWDISRFTTSGNIVVVPEPGRMGLLLVALGGVMVRRRRQTL